MTAMDSAALPDRLVDERRYRCRLPDALNDFVVVWSGSMERAGLCPRLSSYDARSSLLPNGDASKAATTMSERGEVDRRTAGEVAPQCVIAASRRHCGGVFVPVRHQQFCRPA
jgi:hypothetical protein